MPVVIDGVEYDSHSEYLAETLDLDPYAYQYPVLITVETTYLVWVEGDDPAFAKPGETPAQQAVRKLQEDGAAYEILDSKPEAVDGGWKVEPLWDDTPGPYGPFPNSYGAVDALTATWDYGPRLANGQWSSDHARQLQNEQREARRASLPPRPARPAIRTVELPVEDVPA